MKNTKLILGTLAIAAIAGGFYLKNKIEKVSERSYFSEALSTESKKTQGWVGASEYLNSLYINPLTGKVEPADYDAARQQALNMYSPKAANFTFVEDGPDNVGGRTRAIIVDVNNDNIVYAGAVDGGMFKSTNGGNNWSRLTGWDAATPTLSISSVCMTKNGTLYVGTGGGSLLGESAPPLSTENSDMQDGDGIWYSTNGGATFSQIVGTQGAEITRVAADLSQNDVFYFTGSGQYLKKVTNKGTPVNLNANGVVTSGTFGVSVSADGSVIICGAQSSKLYVSSNGGVSFFNCVGGGSGLTNPIASGGQRMECAVSYEKNTNGKYNLFMAEASTASTIRGVWYSEDHGQNWYQIAPASTPGWEPCISASGQCYYDMVIDAVPGHPDHCVFGGIDLYRWQKTPGSVASDADGQWSKVSQWFAPLGNPRLVHADNHRITWDSNGQMYIGNDGGIYKSFDNTTTFFTPINKGYNVTQFYGIGYGPNGELVGGAQDNGTQYNDHTSLNGMSYADVNGGDGYECEISYMSRGEAIISTIYYGALSRSDDKGQNWQSVSPGASTSFYNAVRLFEDDNDMDSKDSIQFIPDSSMAIGDTARYYSETFSIPLSYVLTQDLTVLWDSVTPATDSVLPNFDTIPGGVAYYFNPTPQDTIMLPDPKQSLFVTHASDIVLTRDMLRFGHSMINTNSAGDPWWNLGITGEGHSYEFSKDGNTLWVGTSGGKLVRVTGLDSAYSKAAADISFRPVVGDSIVDLSTLVLTEITSANVNTIDYSAANYRYGDVGNSSIVTYKLGVTTVIGSGNIITDISTDPNNLDRVMYSTGSSLGTVRLCSNARATSPTFVDIGTNLPNYPVFGCEFINNPASTDIVLVGTEFGAYSTDNPVAGATWSAHTGETGLVPVFDVRQQWRNANQGVSNPYEVYLGTHGRGIWKSGSYLSTDENVETIETVENISGIKVYPNPLSSEGNIAFELGNRSDVEFKIYDLQGRVVNQIVWRNMTSGKHSVNFNVGDLPSGTYLVTLKAGATTEVSKFIKF